MVLVRHNGRTVLFSHVPKAGGSSVEKFLAKRYGSLMLLDPTWVNSRSWASVFSVSPQHLSASTIKQLYPTDTIDWHFALVRDPLSRMLSEFRHQLAAPKKRVFLHATGFSGWFAAMVSATADCGSFLGNHFRLQSDIVSQDATTFRLENGMQPV